MSVYWSGACETPHDSVADAMDCCSEQFEDDDDDQGAAPVAMADGGVPIDEALAGDGISAGSWRLNRTERDISIPREVFTRYGYDDGERLDLVVDGDGLHFLRDAEGRDDAGLPADGDWAERWEEQARANVDEWGIQTRQTLLLAAQEELGELTQAALEATHEDGDPERIQAEVDDLGALLVQLTALLPDGNSELVTDGGTPGGREVRACPECDEPDPKPRVFSERARDPDTDHDYACPACGARFDEPVTREPYFEDRNGRRGLAGDLEDASPDDLRADGGTPGGGTNHSVWGARTRRDCRRCGEDLYSEMPNGLCPECVRETPGECHICEEHGERVCGYHGTALWYCVECGHVRRVGNQPVRPGEDVTKTCCVSLHPDRDVFNLPTMVRLCYESVAPPMLRRYHKQRSRAWNKATRQHNIRYGHTGTDQSEEAGR